MAHPLVISLLSATLASGAPSAATWRAIGPSYGAVARLAFGPSGKMWAATASSAVFRSDDAGTTWRAASAGLPARNTFRGLVAPASDPSMLLLAPYNEGIFRTTDGGASWKSANGGLTVPQGLDAPEISALSSDGLWPETLYAGGAWNVWVSHDLGATWSATTLETGVFTVAAARGSAGIAYASTYGPVGLWAGFFRTTDGGATWQRGSTPPGQGGSWHLATDPRFPTHVYAPTTQGLYKSTDGGDTWGRLAGGLPNPGAFAPLSVDSAGSLYIVSGSGLYRSEDGGSTFTHLAGAPPLLTVEADPVHAGRLLGAAAEARVFLSNDRGESWSEVDDGLHASSVRSFVVKKGLLLAMAGPLMRSTDGGATWEKKLTSCPSGAVHLTQGPDKRQPSILAGCGDILRSVDGGATFSTAFSTQGGTVHLFTASAETGTLYAAGETSPGGPDADTFGVLFRSTDGGASWVSWPVPWSSSAPIPFHVASLAAMPGNVLLAGAARSWRQTLLGIHRSTDGGQSFEKTSFPDVEVPALAVDPSTNVAWAGAADGLYRSTDGGVSWSPASPKLAGIGVTSLALDGAGALVVGTRSGVFRSTDGTRFTDLTGDLANSRVLSLQGWGASLYAGTEEGGIFVLDATVPTGGAAPGVPRPR